MSKYNTFAGCLIGGAAGDALGYAVEFCSLSEITRIFGEKGVTRYVPIQGLARISDDTQMTLFTAAGLLTDGLEGVRKAYVDWYDTQIAPFPAGTEGGFTWIKRIPELFDRRAPGMTCLTAAQAGAIGSTEHPINDSKGCGGIMRVAPIGLYFGKDELPIEEIDRLGAEAAAFTHGHELGFLPAAAFVHMVHRIAHHGMTPREAVEDAVDTLPRLFPKAEHLHELIDLLEKAVMLAYGEIDDRLAVSMLGEGWVAEEMLAIAVYCALKYEENFEKALIAAVNHDGDSDSTGAVTGNLLGAYVGLEGIPEVFTDTLELRELIEELAEDLTREAEHTAAWQEKYASNRYHA